MQKIKGYWYKKDNPFNRLDKQLRVCMPLQTLWTNSSDTQIYAIQGSFSY